MNDREEVCKCEHVCERESYVKELLDSCDCVGICNSIEVRIMRMYRKKDVEEKCM